MSGGYLDFSLKPVSFAALPGWAEDDPSALFAIMRSCLEHITAVKPYRSGSLGLTNADLMPLLQAASAFAPTDAGSARRFFETECQPFHIAKDDGRSGFVTAFYEPEVEVSGTPDDIWKYPFYRRPPDLVDVDDDNRPASLEPSYAFGRLDGDHVVAYPDRRDIDQGYLDGQGLEIAWARSKVDVFFAHIQGAARLRYPDGIIKRITFSAKAGHPFSAIGKLLIDRGDIDAREVSMQTIRRWLSAHPQQVDAVLWHNRSYIFFREAAVDDPELGPVAAAKVPLVAGRSLAVDRAIHTFGFPFFIHSPKLTHLDDGKPFQRLLMAIETGTAIVGAARGDIFTGSGDAAGEAAGTVRDDADFYILLPRAAAARYL